MRLRRTIQRLVWKLSHERAFLDSALPPLNCVQPIARPSFSEFQLKLQTFNLLICEIESTNSFMVFYMKSLFTESTDEINGVKLSSLMYLSKSVFPNKVQGCLSDVISFWNSLGHNYSLLHWFVDEINGVKGNCILLSHNNVRMDL